MTESSTIARPGASAESPIPVERPSLPSVRCTSWCRDGHGHGGTRHLADQYCYSIYLEMRARLYVDPDEGDTVTVYARKNADSDTPFVVVCTPDDHELRLTLEEVDRLVDRLQHAAWVAEQDAEKRNAFEIGRDVGADRGRS